MEGTILQWDLWRDGGDSRWAGVCQSNGETVSEKGLCGGCKGETVDEHGQFRGVGGGT